MAPPVDAWDDDWETAADKTVAEPPKKLSSKVTKAQRRAAQAEFNRQLWEQAEGPGEPNYFLETRDILPKADFKPIPTLLTRRSSAQRNGAESSSEDDENRSDKKKALTLEEQRAIVAKERDEKQRKYEERRMELFGSTTGSTNISKPVLGADGIFPGGWGDTPPVSRSTTPNRSRGGRGATGVVVGGRKVDPPSRPASSSASSLSLNPTNIGSSKKELFDPNYSQKSHSLLNKSTEKANTIEPVRSPRAPYESGRGGFGFAPRGGGKD